MNPLNRMESFLDSFGDVNVSTALDYNLGYWKISLVSFDQEKTHL